MSTTTELSKERIREIFLANGFTIKEGQTDLRPYVYEAAAALLAAAHGEPSNGDSIKSYHIGEPQPFPMDAAMSILKSGLERARQAGSAEQVSEREAFEKWAMPDGMQARKDAEGNYCDIGMSAGWSAWQARAALQHTATAPSKAGEWTNQQLCDLLPESVMWGDNLTPELVREILSRALSVPAQAAQSEDKAARPASQFNAYGAPIPLAALSAPEQGAQAEQSEDARDAARYRWLRSKAFRSAAGGWMMFDAAIKLPQVDEGMDGAFDAAIDAAMSTTPSEKDGGK